MSTIPSLALIPSGYKASKVYSVLPTDGTGDFTFSRASSATRVNSDGLIETVGSNVPRLNYPMIDGVVSGCPSLLLEPAGTNLFPYSNDVSFWSKSNVITTSDYAISPDGTQNAFRAVFSSSTGLLYISALGTTGTNNTLSVWAKSNNGSSNKFRFFGNGNTTKSNDYVATNEWQRFEFTFNCTAVTAGLTGASDSATNDILFYGFQHEVGSYATSYIPTNGSAATRIVDYSLGQLTTGFFNDNEGTLFLYFKAFENDTSYRYIAISDGTVSNRVVITIDNTFRIQCAVSLSGVTQSNVIKQMTNNSLSSGFKVAMTYKNNEFKSFVNGVETTPRDTSGSVFPTGTLKYLRFTQGNATSGPLNGETSAVQYYNTVLIDTDLEELTSWMSFSEMARELLYTIE